MDPKDLKYKDWMVTISSGAIDLPLEETVVIRLKKFCEGWAFQKEIHANSEIVGSTHFQMYLRTTIRVRQQTLLKILKTEFVKSPMEEANYNITVDKMMGSREQAIAYCTKDDSRQIDSKPWLSPDILVEYCQKDLEVMLEPSNRFRWQNKVIDLLFENCPHNIKVADDRSVMWITDQKGNSGKSKLVKYLCVNNDAIIKIPFGSAQQLRSAIVSAGPKMVYFIDIPRTVGDDDSINNVITVVEDLKNSHVCSVMYGKYEQLFFEPPHVVIFSNAPCPVSLLSVDRWRRFYIFEKDLLEVEV